MMTGTIYHTCTIIIYIMGPGVHTGSWNESKYSYRIHTPAVEACMIEGLQGFMHLTV